MEELVYEGSLPGGVGVIVDALSDNKNRTAGEVRATFKKHGGALGAPGSVAWNWRRVAEIRPAVPVDEDKLFEVAVEAGADDVVDDAVFADPALSASIRDALDAAGFVVEASDRIWIPGAPRRRARPHAAPSTRSTRRRRERRVAQRPIKCACYDPLLARRTPSFHLLETAHRRHVAPFLGLAAEVLHEGRVLVGESERHLEL